MKTREDKYMQPLMDQTYRVTQYQKQLTHGDFVESPHILSIIAHYRELGDMLELVLKDKAASPQGEAAEAAKGGREG